MRTLADRTSSVAAGRGEAAWNGYEYVRGWGVFGLPFDSGHVLALRVFPQNPFAPYVTAWHRDPAGRWTIYVDAPRSDIACPRYYGAACDRIVGSTITLRWTGPATLQIRVDEPDLEWTVAAREPWLLRRLNGVGAAMPLWTWRHRSLLRAREMLARRLGMGRLELAGVMPSGHPGILMPQRMYLVDDSTATLGGTDLGNPARLAVNPEIGGIPLPARGVLAIGQAMWEIVDRAEYDRTRAETANYLTVARIAGLRSDSGSDRPPG